MEDENCPRNEHLCFAGTCVGELEADFEDTWGVCVEGAHQCSDDMLAIRTCNETQPGWGDAVTCPETQPICVVSFGSSASSCMTCGGRTTEHFSSSKPVTDCQADSVCSACLQSERPECASNLPYRRLVALGCPETPNESDPCCYSICTEYESACNSSTICCGGAYCQGGICVI